MSCQTNTFFSEFCPTLPETLYARGEDLADAEKNLRNAIELYLVDIKENPETAVSPISTEEFIEFFGDTESECYKEPPEILLLRPLEVYEVPSYAWLIFDLQQRIGKIAGKRWGNISKASKKRPCNIFKNGVLLASYHSLKLCFIFWQ